MDGLATPREQRADGWLGEPVDLEVGDQLAQLARDRHVAPGVAKADRGADKQRPTGTSARANPGATSMIRPAQAACEIVDQPVDQDGMSCVWEVTCVHEPHVLAADKLGEREAALKRLAVVA